MRLEVKMYFFCMFLRSSGVLSISVELEVKFTYLEPRYFCSRFNVVTETMKLMMRTMATPSTHLLKDRPSRTTGRMRNTMKR